MDDEEDPSDLECFDDSLSDIPGDVDEFYSYDDGSDDDRLYDENYNTGSPRESEEFSEDVDVGWSDVDTPRNNESFLGTPGVKVFPQDTSNIESVVSLFLTDEFFEKIATETNRFFNQNKEKYKDTPEIVNWNNVTIKEMKKFFGVSIMMSKIWKHEFNYYWSTDPCIETSFFRKVMDMNRFLQIFRFLHFNNNKDIDENSKRLAKVQFLVDFLSKKFQTIYTPGKILSLEEAVIRWKKKLCFRTFHPSHFDAYGVLCQMVYEPATKYISNFEMHSEPSPKPEDCVVSLLSPFCGLQHHIYMDKYYTTVSLAFKLLEDKFRMCGTICVNKGEPNSLKNLDLKSGEMKFERKGEVLLEAWKVSKNHNIRIISTIHNSEMKDTTQRKRQTGERIRQPASFLEYTNQKRGVYRANQCAAFHFVFSKTKKWPKRTAFFLMNCALYNSFVVYKHLNPTKKIKYDTFFEEIAMAWIKNIENEEVPGPSCATSSVRYPNDRPKRCRKSSKGKKD